MRQVSLQRQLMPSTSLQGDCFCSSLFWMFFPLLWRHGWDEETIVPCCRMLQRLAMHDSLMKLLKDFFLDSFVNPNLSVNLCDRFTLMSWKRPSYPFKESQSELPMIGIRTMDLWGLITHQNHPTNCSEKGHPDNHQVKPCDFMPFIEHQKLLSERFREDINGFYGGYSTIIHIFLAIKVKYHPAIGVPIQI